MTLPVRLRFHRRRGFDMQAVSRAVNGLPGMRVTRPGTFGNWFKIGIDGEAKTCVGRFRSKLNAARNRSLGTDPLATRILRNLVRIRECNLFCACSLCPVHERTGLPLGTICADCAPCHADVLLEIANR